MPTNGHLPQRDPLVYERLDALLKMTRAIEAAVVTLALFELERQGERVPLEDKTRQDALDYLTEFAHVCVTIDDAIAREMATNES